MSKRRDRAHKRKRADAVLKLVAESAAYRRDWRSIAGHGSRLDAIEQRLDALDSGRVGGAQKAVGSVEELEARQRDLAARVRRLSRTTAALTLRIHRSQAATAIDRRELCEFAGELRAAAAALERRAQLSQQEADADAETEESTDASA